MSREYYQAMEVYHDELAAKFAAGKDGVKRHVEVRINDKIYVYLHENGTHVQTQTIDIPDAWYDNCWPNEDAIRRFIRRHCQLGRARITTLEA